MGVSFYFFVVRLLVAVLSCAVGAINSMLHDGTKGPHSVLLLVVGSQDSCFGIIAA